MINDPELIEKKSFEIIRSELSSLKIDVTEQLFPIVARVIHATADFEFAKSLIFTKSAVADAIVAVRAGAPIITDVNMIKSAVKSPIVKKFGSQVICRISDDDIRLSAKENKTTRAKMSMNMSKNLINGGIVIVGNSPTALYEVIRLVKEENIKPKLIIGVPVGFVEAAESKEALLSLDGISYITNKGRKGGSPVAASIINAILLLAEN